MHRVSVKGSKEQNASKGEDKNETANSFWGFWKSYKTWGEIENGFLKIALDWRGEWVLPTMCAQFYFTFVFLQGTLLRTLTTTINSHKNTAVI